MPWLYLWTFNFLIGNMLYQGMNDYLSPLLFVMEDESEAFWCFAALMEHIGPNFNRDQSGMQAQLFALSKVSSPSDRCAVWILVSTCLDIGTSIISSCIGMLCFIDMHSIRGCISMLYLCRAAILWHLWYFACCIAVLLYLNYSFYYLSTIFPFWGGGCCSYSYYCYSNADIWSPNFYIDAAVIFALALENMSIM